MKAYNYKMQKIKTYFIYDPSFHLKTNLRNKTQR